MYICLLLLLLLFSGDWFFISFDRLIFYVLSFSELHHIILIYDFMHCQCRKKRRIQSKVREQKPQTRYISWCTGHFFNLCATRKKVLSQRQKKKTQTKCKEKFNQITFFRPSTQLQFIAVHIAIFHNSFLCLHPNWMSIDGKKGTHKQTKQVWWAVKKES